MPSSTMVGSRPIRSRMRSYSSGLRPCSATIFGVIFVIDLSRGGAFLGPARRQQQPHIVPAGFLPVRRVAILPRYAEEKMRHRALYNPDGNWGGLPPAWRCLVRGWIGKRKAEDN